MKALLKSFAYAFRGIARAVKSERNMRIHLTAAIYVTAFSFFYELSKAEYVLLILTFSSVISCEMINTAVEKVVDICSPRYSKAAELAKDVSAGAVLVTAIFAVITGIILFGDTVVIKEIFAYYRTHIAALAGLVLSLAAAALFIFYPFKKNRSDAKEE